MRKLGVLFISLLLLSVISVSAHENKVQDDPLKSAERQWKLLFDESVEWYGFGYFQNALRGFKRLLVKDRKHANVNFYVAMCYYYMRRPADIIVPYLEKAVVKVDPYYSYSYKEKSAPVFAWLYLGEMYMYTYKFDAAEKAFREFKTYLTDRNRDAAYLIQVNNWLENVVNAKEFYANKNKSITVQNMKQLNSNYNDYKPFLSRKGTKLFMTTERKGTTGGQYLRDVYKADVYLVLNKRGNWSRPKKLAYRINSKSDDMCPSMGEGDKYLVYSREDKNKKDYNLYYAEANGKRFKAPQKFNPNINTKHNESSPYIVLNGSVMYFSSDKPGGYGGKDIYMAERMPNGEWGRPYNLGPNINTDKDEDCPFVLDDGVTLFFSSKGHKNMGGYDIFVSTLSDEGIWSEPENMGYPINTTYDDIGFMMTPDGTKGYYATARDAHENAYINNLDIFEIFFGE